MELLGFIELGLLLGVEDVGTEVLGIVEDGLEPLGFEEVGTVLGNDDDGVELLGFNDVGAKVLGAEVLGKLVGTCAFESCINRNNNNDNNNNDVYMEMVILNIYNLNVE